MAMVTAVVCQLPNENPPIAPTLLIDHQTLLFNAQLANEMEQFEEDLVDGFIMGRNDCIDSIEEHIDQCFENHLPGSEFMVMITPKPTQTLSNYLIFLSKKGNAFSESSVQSCLQGSPLYG